MDWLVRKSSADTERAHLNRILAEIQAAIDAVGGGTYTDADAQDAVGGILTDSSTVDFTYVSATSITADVLNSPLLGGQAGSYYLDRTNHTGTQAWGTITGTPTTLAGYGITDAQGLDTQLTSLAGLSYTGNSLKVVRVNAGETSFELATLTFSVADGDYGDITVSSSGSVWTIDASSVTLAKMADVATGTVFYRKTAGTGAPEVQTLATLKTDLGLTGTNSGDQTITLTGDVTGTGTGSFATTLATTQSAAHTWASTQTFSVAPVFTDASGSRTALGATTVGANFFTLTNPSAVTFIRINADNSITTRSAANFKSDLALTSSDVGLGSVTNDAQTKAAIVPNTAPSAGQILVGNAGGTAYAPVTASGDATISSAGAITLAAAQKAVGLHSFPIMAASMFPSYTGGCGGLSQIASGTNKPDIIFLPFDATTEEYAQFWVPMPKGWDESTITFKVGWSHASTTTNFKVAWALQGVAVSDDDTIGVAYGTAVQVNDTGGTTDDLYTTPMSSAVTIAGSPAAEDLVCFRVYRVAADGTNDTLAIDARLQHVILYITTDAANDS
jgi:hypothetical protein